MSGIARLDYEAMKRQFASGDNSKPADAHVEPITADTDNHADNTESDSSINSGVKTDDTDNIMEDEEKDDIRVGFAKTNKSVPDQSVSQPAKQSEIKPDKPVDHIDPSEDFKKSFVADNTSSNPVVPIANFDNIDTTEPDNTDNQPDILDTIKETLSRPASSGAFYSKPNTNLQREEPESTQIKPLANNRLTKPVARTYNNSDDTGCATIKKFPRELLRIAQGMFPDAENQTFALAAYVYYKAGCPSDIEFEDKVFGEKVKQLVKNCNNRQFTAEDLQNSFMDSLASVDNRLRKLIAVANAIELGLAYSISDGAGFIAKDPDTPADIEFLEKSITDILRRLNDQSDLHQQRLTIKEGRAFRQNIDKKS